MPVARMVVGRDIYIYKGGGCPLLLPLLHSRCKSLNPGGRVCFVKRVIIRYVGVFSQQSTHANRMITSLTKQTLPPGLWEEMVGER